MIGVLSGVLLVLGVVAFFMRLGWFVFKKVTGRGDLSTATYNIQTLTEGLIDQVVIIYSSALHRCASRSLSFFEDEENAIKTKLREELIAEIDPAVRGYVNSLNDMLRSAKLPLLKAKEAQKITSIVLDDEFEIEFSYTEEDEAEIRYRPGRGLLGFLALGIFGFLLGIGMKTRAEKYREQSVDFLEKLLDGQKNDRYLRVQRVSNLVMNKTRLRHMQVVGEVVGIFNSVRLLHELDAPRLGSPEHRQAFRKQIKYSPVDASIEYL